MRTLLLWSLLGSCAAVGAAIAGVVVLAVDPTTEEHVTSMEQASLQRAAELDVEPAARRMATEVTPEPPVSTQIAPLSEGIKEVGERLAGQQEALLKALEEIKSQALKQPPAAAQPPAPPAAGGDQAAAPPPPNATIEAEGDDRLRLNIQDADIRDVLEMLSRQGELNILPSPSVTGTVNATLSGVTVEEALQAILHSAQLVSRREGNFVFVGTPEDIQGMQQAAEQVEVRVFRPNYVTAADLQALITPLLSATGEATVGQGRVAVSSPAQTGIPSDGTQTGGDAFAQNEVVIVRDYSSVLHQIEQLVKEIDQRPRQVAIEAVILSVKIDDSNSLGVNFELLRNKDNVRLISGTPLSNLASLNLNDGGLKFGFLDTSLAAFVDALETIGDTNVVASPRVVCLNKQRAEILIGSELGYVSTTVTENSATQSVEFLEVGTQLRIRPFISDDRMVRLEVHPELSTGSVRVEQGLTLPDKEVTQVTTNILCPDSKTLVIGGLIREDLATTSSHIPFLGRAPLIGPLFRSTSETTEKREIIVLLTPRIIDDPWTCGEDDEAAEAFLRRQAIYADKMSPLGTRYQGRVYLRLAKAAFSAGDVETAFRYTQVALHFDPDNLQANNLRAQLVQIRPDLDLPIRRRLREGLPVWERPMRNYAREGYSWKQPIGAGMEGDIVIEETVEEVHPVEVAPPIRGRIEDDQTPSPGR